MTDTVFYDEMAGVVTELIGDGVNFSQPALLIRKDRQQYNAVAGKYDDVQDVEFSVNVVQKSMKTENIDKALIREDDKMYAMDNTVEPKRGDELKIDGVVVGKVERVSPANPAGIVLAYTIQVRA
jgi:hypothetical protein